MEPVTVAQAKLYMNIDSDYTEMDGIISDLITSAREWIEQYTGLSLIEKDLTAYVKESAYEIPNGPVIQIDGLKDLEGTDVQYTKIGPSDYPVIYLTRYPAVISYKAGYAEGKVPSPIIEAIKMLTQTNYENRESFVVGQTINEAPNGVISKIQPYSRSGGLFL